MNNPASTNHGLIANKLQGRFIIFLAVFFILLGYALVFTLSQPVGIGLLVASCCVLLFFFKPFWITLAFVFLSAWGFFLNLPITHDGIALSTMALVTGFLILAVRGILTKDSGLIVIPFSKFRHLLVPSLLLVTVISLVNSRDIGLSIQEIKRFSFCVLCYLLVILTVRDGWQLKKIVVCMVCAGFFVSILGLLEAMSENIYTYFDYKSLFGSPIWVTGNKIRVDRLQGLLGCSDAHGMYMALIFGFSFYLFLDSKSKMVGSVLCLVMLSTLFNIIGTAARGAILAFLFSLLIFWLFLEASRKWLVVIFGSLMVLVFCTVALAPDLDVKRIYTYEGRQKSTVELRWHNAYIGLMMLGDHPLIGSGPHGYVTNYGRYVSRVLPEGQKSVIRLHNAYLETLVNYGIIGFAIFIVIIFSTIKSLFFLIRRLSGSNRCLAVSIFSAVCGYSVYMMATGWLVSQTYWLLLGLAGATCEIYEVKAPDVRG